MLATAHIAFGAFFGTIYMFLTKDINLIGFLVAAFGGMFPDLDSFIHFFRGRKFDESFNHHSWPTHTPFFHLIVFTIIALVEFLLSGKILYSILFVIGSLSHLMMDTIGSINGIMFFWPISKKYFNLISIDSKHGKKWVKDYVSKWYFVFIEIFAIFLGVLSFIFVLKN